MENDVYIWGIEKMDKFDFVKEVEEKQAPLLEKLRKEVESFPKLEPNGKPYYFYNMAYRTLRDFTRDYIKQKNKERREIDVLALAHMVYGWMPTILNIDKDKKGKKEQPSNEWLNNFNEALETFKSDFNEITKIKEIIDKNRLNKIVENVKKITNNSVIGASKLLHFINPEFFPIYDSRVFHAIRKLSEFKKEKEDWDTVDKVDKYISYIAMILKWRNNTDELNKIRPKLTNNNYIDDKASDIRVLEVALFIYGGK